MSINLTNNYFITNNTETNQKLYSDLDYSIEIKNKDQIDAYKKSESFSKKIKVNVEK